MGGLVHRFNGLDIRINIKRYFQFLWKIAIVIQEGFMGFFNGLGSGCGCVFGVVLAIVIIIVVIASAVVGAF